MLDVLPDALSTAVPLTLAGTSFALGVRHGLDWDHIAAITDLTAPRTDDVDHRHAGRRGLSLSTCYCVGHGLVLAVLGGLVLALGVGLPAGMDVAFEHLVGITLVSLGGVVLYQLGRYRSDYRYTGRISLVVGALRRGWARARRRDVPGGAVDVDSLVARGAVRKNQPVKVLGNGEIGVAVQVTADKFSASAKTKIEAAGGSVSER